MRHLGGQKIGMMHTHPGVEVSRERPFSVVVVLTSEELQVMWVTRLNPGGGSEVASKRELVRSPGSVLDEELVEVVTETGLVVALLPG